MTAFAHIDGHTVVEARVIVPRTGAWFADVVLAEAPTLAGLVTLTLGDRRLSGTVAASHSGTEHLQGKVRIVAGAGAWGRQLSAKPYHADNGVRARLVAEDAAREAGETLAAFDSTATVGVDFVRRAGPAAVTLERAAGALDWWVDYDGRTHVGTRTAAEPDQDAYEVLEYDPAGQMATIAVEDLGVVQIGATLRAGLDVPQTVREMELVVTGEADGVRVRAWLGSTSERGGRLSAAVASVVRRVLAERIYGKRLYRVVSVAAADGRVDLQAVERSAGLPDLRSISMWPGVAGVHAEVASSAEVLVEFIDGDPAKPIVTHFAGKDGVGFVPTRIDIGNAPTSYVALATKVDLEIDKLWTALGDHVHAVTVTGSATTQSGTTLPPSVTDTSASTASTLVRST